MTHKNTAIDIPRFSKVVYTKISKEKTYGHEIIQTARLANAHIWVALSDKHVYYVLRKLAGKGLVTESEERIGNTPPRNVYEITDEGRRALREMLLSPGLQHTFEPTPFDVVVGMLAYTDALNNKEALEVLKARSAALNSRLAEQHPVESLQGIGARFGGLAYTKLPRSISRVFQRLFTPLRSAPRFISTAWPLSAGYARTSSVNNPPAWLDEVLPSLGHRQYPDKSSVMKNKWTSVVRPCSLISEVRHLSHMNLSDSIYPPAR